FGYNSHPNLLWNLNLAPLGETLVSLVDGTFEPHFSPGFGASVSMYTDHPRPGKVIGIPEEAARNVYLYDGRAADGLLVTSGYSKDVAIALGFGYTIPTAWEACLAVARQVTFPGRAFRIDGAGTDFPSSPVRRYEALVAMGYV